MDIITCKSCGEKIEVDKALEGQIEERVLSAERHKHKEELAKVRLEQEAIVKQERETASQQAEKKLEGEIALHKQQVEADLELTKKKLELQATSAQKKAQAEQESLIASLKDDADSAKQDSKKLRDELSGMMKLLREEKNARANAELEAERRLAKSEDKIRESVQRESDEKQRLRILEKDKQLDAAKRQVEEMQRKLHQGSQQMQGEILELDLEEALQKEFADDDVQPVDKGVKGADVKHVVKSPRGTECGVILWEIKRTKNWTEGWVAKLKDDLRATKANIPVIITEAMPKNTHAEILFHNGIYVAKPGSALILASLLRKSLLDVGREKAIAKHRDTSADALYSFVTSHEFVHQIEAMVEVYNEMIIDITKEKSAFDRIWAKREAHAKKLLSSTAQVIGSMHGMVGSSSMPKIKGLELDLLGSGDDNEVA